MFIRERDNWEQKAKEQRENKKDKDSQNVLRSQYWNVLCEILLTLLKIFGKIYPHFLHHLQYYTPNLTILPPAVLRVHAIKGIFCENWGSTDGVFILTHMMIINNQEFLF